MTSTPHGRQLLADWIERSRLKQNELASRLGITDSYLSQVLSGIRRPKLETLILIERMTGVPVVSWADTEDSDSDRASTAASKGPAFLRVK